VPEAYDRFASHWAVAWFGSVPFFADVALVTRSRAIPKFDNVGRLGSEAADGREREDASEDQTGYQGLLHVKSKAN
jgi:hypothetical protein